ncbi:FAD-dependent thymidylate synthase [Anaerosporobacter sp.]
MKIEIINKEELIDLYKNHGLFACTCYDTDDKYADKVGKSCNESQHMSGSRCEYIKFRLYDIDRGSSEQLMRHEIGVSYDEIDKYAYNDRIEILVDLNPSSIVKNMQSFRYVDKNEFTYSIPTNIIKSTKALERYENLMDSIDRTRKEIRDILVDEGICDYKQAVEDANFVLPRATNLTLTIGFTPEALMHFMHKRLCTRSQEFIRKIAVQMKAEVNSVLPEYASQLVPHCQHLLWCPESKRKTCKAYPSKDELIKILDQIK